MDTRDNEYYAAMAPEHGGANRRVVIRTVELTGKQQRHVTSSNRSDAAILEWAVKRWGNRAMAAHARKLGVSFVSFDLWVKIGTGPWTSLETAR